MKTALPQIGPEFPESLRELIHSYRAQAEVPHSRRIDQVAAVRQVVKHCHGGGMAAQARDLGQGANAYIKIGQQGLYQR